LIDRRIEYVTLHAYEGKPFPASNNFDSFIVAGTPISINEIGEYGFLRKEHAYLRDIVNSNKPCLGICFGAQLLASILGAEVSKDRVMEIGKFEVRLTPVGQKVCFFKGFPLEFPVFQWHVDTFNVPEGAKILVTGDECRNQAFKHKNIVGLLFHLEITADEASNWTSEYRDELNAIGKTAVQVVDECRVSEKLIKQLAYLWTISREKMRG
jgi:GMP synthase (glutamine-hydrolysing)